MTAVAVRLNGVGDDESRLLGTAEGAGDRLIGGEADSVG